MAFSSAALTSTGDLHQRGGRFELTQTARLYLLRDSEFYWIPMLRAAGFGQATTDMLMHTLRTENLGEDDRVTCRWERGEMTVEDAHASSTGGGRFTLLYPAL